MHRTSQINIHSYTAAVHGYADVRVSSVTKSAEGICENTVNFVV